MSLAALLRALRPRRTIRPTRDGWWCLGAAVGLGFAAMNTGNNLLYLLASLLLGLIIVSGILSEQSMRRLRLAAVVPDEIYAGRATVVGARVRNLKRRLSTYSVALEVDGRRLYVDRLPAGDERLVTWEARFDARGRRRLRRQDCRASGPARGAARSRPWRLSSRARHVVKATAPP